MGQWNEILAARFNRFAQKLLSMKGPASLPTLSPDLFLVHPFQTGAENRWIEGWDQFGFAVDAALSAAQKTGIQLRNPPNSGVIAAVFVAEANTQGAAGIQVDLFTTITTADLPQAATGPLAMDARSGQINPLGALAARGSACIPSFGFPGTPGGAPTRVATRIVANAGGVVNGGFNADFCINGLEIPLAPGGAVAMTSFAINTSISGGFIWRERAIEDSERK